MGLPRREKNKSSFCRLERPRPFRRTLPEAPLEPAQNGKKNVCKKVVPKNVRTHCTF